MMDILCVSPSEATKEFTQNNYLIEHWGLTDHNMHEYSLIK